MAKQIKFPLIMNNGVEVRSIEELRENFDIVATIEYFTIGKLQRWLESNYYDDILKEIENLTGEEEDFSQKLSEAIGVAINGNCFYGKDIIRQTKLKEELKRYVSEKELNDMEHIAESQQDLERFINAGYKKIYLFGKKFTLPKYMKNMECVGINKPVISVEAESREEFRSQNIKVRDVEFTDSEIRKIVIDEPILDGYLEAIKVLTVCLGEVAKKVVDTTNTNGTVHKDTIENREDAMERKLFEKSKSKLTEGDKEETKVKSGNDDGDEAMEYFARLANENIKRTTSTLIKARESMREAFEHMFDDEDNED